MEAVPGVVVAIFDFVSLKNASSLSASVALSELGVKTGKILALSSVWLRILGVELVEFMGNPGSDMAALFFFLVILGVLSFFLPPTLPASMVGSSSKGTSRKTLKALANLSLSNLVGASISKHPLPDLVTILNNRAEAEAFLMVRSVVFPFFTATNSLKGMVTVFFLPHVNAFNEVSSVNKELLSALPIPPPLSLPGFLFLTSNTPFLIRSRNRLEEVDRELTDTSPRKLRSSK
jgi:hypothetical protein